MSKKIKISLLSILVLCLLLTTTASALAKTCAELKAEGQKSWLNGIVKDGLLIPCECLSSKTSEIEQCDLSKVFQTIINFSQLLLALTGSAALLMFIYGGVTWIVAAGNQERIQKGKSALAAAAVGIVIILGAWLIVNTVIMALTKGQVHGPAQIFDTMNWFEEPGNK